MNMIEPIRIFYFSDMLCVWAYIAQIRLDELKAKFPTQISIEYHFTPVFGDAQRKLEQRWVDRGGFNGYSQHVRDVAAKFKHISVHPEIWTQAIPTSSTSCHLFLRAVKLLEDKGLVTGKDGNSVMEIVAWALRTAFFTELADISDRKIQLRIAKELGLPVNKIKAEIDSGAAYAELSRDFELTKEHNVTVSPTLIFNEGRQRLNGNVGYRVIEANIRELLSNPPHEQSWC
jgi:predicted DsbA family dithiol-disulfide isomerase